jgi:hypothetical protein
MVISVFKKQEDILSKYNIDEYWEHYKLNINIVQGGIGEWEKADCLKTTSKKTQR